MGLAFCFFRFSNTHQIYRLKSHRTGRWRLTSSKMVARNEPEKTRKANQTQPTTPVPAPQLVVCTRVHWCPRQALRSHPATPIARGLPREDVYVHLCLHGRCTSSAQLWDQLLRTDRKLLPRSSVAAECHRLVLLDTVSNRPTPRSQSGLVPPQYASMVVVPPLPSGTRSQRFGVRVCLPRSSIRPLLC